MDLSLLFRQILKPALGCTEPVAVALASAAALQASAGWTPPQPNLPLCGASIEVESIRLRVSKSIFKNSFAISIPNAEGHKGLLMAATLGLFCDPNKALRVFEDLTHEHIAHATALVARKAVLVEVPDDVPDIYINVEVAGANGLGASLIQGEHASLSVLWQNGRAVYNSARHTAAQTNDLIAELQALTFAEVIALAEQLPLPVVSLLQETVEKNVKACKAALIQPMGIGTGYYGDTSQGGGIAQHISSLTAAGSDARMSGYPVEIMTSAGSGNQGIAATLPIVAYAKAHLIDDDRMLKAVGLSNLVTMYLTSHLGYLSALCGVAIKAGTGAACGLTYLMGGDETKIERALKIMAATLTGTICDGAKAGCALKVSIAADMALRAATLAMKDAEVPDDNGIVAATADQTILNLAKLNRSMGILDKTIIQIMLSKTLN